MKSLTKYFSIKTCLVYIVSILLIILAVNVVVYNYIWYEYQYQNLLRLEVQHNLIKSFVIEKLEILNQDKDKPIHSKILQMKEYLRNYVLVTNISLSNNNKNLEYTTLQDILNELSNQTFNYNITVNGQQIINNGIVDINNCMTKQHSIGKSLSCDISLQINPNSHYVKQSITRINYRILLVIVASSIIFIISILIVVYLLIKDRKIKVLLDQLNTDLNNNIRRTKNILLFYKVNEEFTLKCYQYFKQSFDKNSYNKIWISDSMEKVISNEYFPLPIVKLEDKQENNSYNIKLNPIITDLENYFNGYTACYNPNIILEIMNYTEQLIAPFEQEIFNQVIMSILSNVLYFNKDIENKRYVKLIFQDTKIVYSSNGFRLDQNLAIRYSEQIFNDTANLYILSLGQVFILLKKFQADYSVVRKEDNTTIEIKFNNEITKLSNFPKSKSNIIKLDKFKNTRKEK